MKKSGDPKHVYLFSKKKNKEIKKERNICHACCNIGGTCRNDRGGGEVVEVKAEVVLETLNQVAPDRAHINSPTTIKVISLNYSFHLQGEMRYMLDFVKNCKIQLKGE